MKMINLFKYIAVFFTIFVLFSNPIIIFAQPSSDIPPSLDRSPGSLDSGNNSFIPGTVQIGSISDTCGVFKINGCKDVFEIIFGAVVPTLYVVIFAFSAIFFLVGAIKLVTSAGNAEQVKTAWGQIQSNFVGLVVLLLAVTIFFVVISLVGIGFSFASDITNIK